MRIRSLLGCFVGCASALLAVTALGCGGGSGSVCDIDLGSIAGTYSFKFTSHNTSYLNSCFDNYTEVPVDPATMTNCTWAEESDDETITIELSIEENGDIGSAKILSITGNDVDPDATSLGVKCELLEGAVCDAPVRCNITGDTCSTGPSDSDPEAWKYSCDCSEGSPNDPTSAACQDCKAAYDKYQTEQSEYCQKGRDGDYFEFTLHVNE